MIELVKIGYREFKRFILGKDKFIDASVKIDIEIFKAETKIVYIV